MIIYNVLIESQDRGFAIIEYADDIAYVYKYSCYFKAIQFYVEVTIDYSMKIYNIILDIVNYKDIILDRDSFISSSESSCFA